MILKENLKNATRKVGLSVFNIPDAPMKDGKKSKTITIYDTTADEVLELIKKAINDN